MAPMNPELAAAIIESAKRLGLDPVHLGTSISYETGGRFDPNLWGGAGKNHLGLIQFGPEERKKYGVKEGQTGPEQMLAVENFLRDRGVKPGMGLHDIYSTINAGSPGLYNRSDAANGGAPGTVADKVNTQMAGHEVNARRLLGVDAPVGALATGAAPVPVPVDPVSPIDPTSTNTAGAPINLAPPAAVGALTGVTPGSLQQLAGKFGPQKAEEFAPLQQIAPAAPKLGQSQQIAAALANAYGFGR